MTLLLITGAGAVGAVIRFLGEYLMRRQHPMMRPWATVAANVVGTFIAGFILYSMTNVADIRLQSVILTGFCGGLTTFSSAFAIPAILQREHHWRYSVALVLTTPLLCTGAFVVGTALAH